MGRFATHAAVMAKIRIPDEDGTLNDYGIGCFIVQLRERDTHKHMPGIKCGDIGAKFGYHGKDNGWLSFDSVRIPRKQMLSRFMKVDRNGDFSIEGDVRILYSTMLKTRVHICTSTKLVQMAPILVALRYSVVRR